MMKTQQTKGYFMVFIAGCLWGTNGMFSSWLREQGAESSTIAFLRLFTGALMLIPIMIIMAKGTNLFKIDKKGMIAGLALGVFSQGLFNFTYAEAIAHVGAVSYTHLDVYKRQVSIPSISMIPFLRHLGIYEKRNTG